MYPDRLIDGYGMKNKHLDIIKEKNIDLVITVDN
jgi:single-stranded DNA-specific DHH superfamily exonuclease